MSIRQIVIVGIVGLSLFASGTVFSAPAPKDSPMYQMAEIMHRLKHFPSPQGLEVLKKISQSKTATMNEHSIASAMMNLQHKVAEADAPKLSAIITDKSATENERTLALIVLELDHRPTSEDKAKLKAMME